MNQFDKSILVLPFEGANNSTIITDYSPVMRRITCVGNAKISTAQAKHGSSSLLLDGSGDFLQLGSIYPDLSDFDFGTGPFTISFYIYVLATTTTWPAVLASNNATWTTGARAIALSGTADAHQRKIQVSNYDYTGVFLRSTTQLPLNAWRHVEYSRDALNVHRLFVEGVQEASITWAGSMNFGFGGLANLGWGRWDGANGYLNAHLDSFWIVKGAALHTANFTPPGPLVKTISGVVRDDTGALAVRRVRAYPRSVGLPMMETMSAADGTYSLLVPDEECSRIILDDDAGTLYNDLVDRVIPG